MVEVKEWARGETIRINNTYTDIDGNVYDPDTIEIRIYNPTGALATTVTYAGGEITRVSVGVYYYDYSIAADAILGWWINKWIATNAGFTDTANDQFCVANFAEKLYCSVNEVWNRAGIDSEVATRDEVIPLIKESMAEVDSIFGRTFSYGNSITDWFDTRESDPYVRVRTVKLRYKPVLEVVSVEEYDTHNNLVKTHTGDEYWINEKTGSLRLNRSQFAKQPHRVKVVYSYGYETVPRNVRALCAVFAASRLLIHQIGGTYDDVTSWNAAGLSIGVGEPYMNMSRAIEMLKKESDRLILMIGRLRPSSIVL